MATRVLIADDHAIVRAGLRALVTSERANAGGANAGGVNACGVDEGAGLELVGEASGGVEALALAASLVPDILVLDLSMPDMNGIEVTRRVKAELPQVRVLILTVHEDEDLIRGAIRAGAAGYILKQAAESELLSAIRTVQKGDLYVPSNLLRGLFAQPEPATAAGPRPEELLTPRELDVLHGIVQGYTNRQIADELKLSVRTVEGYRANLTEKLELHTRADLVRYAREHGLLQG